VTPHAWTLREILLALVFVLLIVMMIGWAVFIITQRDDPND
jgi:flagellar biogenesis protein FliO